MQIMYIYRKVDEARCDISMLQRELKGTEQQLEVWFAKEYKRVMTSKWENKFANSGIEGGDKLPNAFGKERKPGSFGHIVQTSSEIQYQGGATYEYEENAITQPDTESKTGSSSSGQFRPTPAPTKEQYVRYGILHSYCSLDSAIHASNNGDHIYLSPGIHKWKQTLYGPGYPITKEIDVIGLGGPDNVIIQIDYSREKECFSVDSKTFEFYNLTFKVTYDRETSILKQFDPRLHHNPHAAYGTGSRAIVTFNQEGVPISLKIATFKWVPLHLLLALLRFAECLLQIRNPQQ
jgi:hypothetical protein